MAFCLVVKCGSTYIRDAGLGIRFYRVPSECDNKGRKQDFLVRRRKAWVHAIRRQDLTETKLKYGRVCSKHFITGKPAHMKDVDNVDWVPSLHMGYEKVSLTETQLRRRARFVERSNREVEATSSFSESSQPVVTEDGEDVTKEDLKMALRECNRQLYTLRQRLATLEFTSESFENSNDHTLYYTGFPSFIYLKSIFEIVENYIPYKHPSPLNKFQQLILTLVKLRLDLPFKDLANRFNCHYTTAARIFHRTLDILYDRLKPLIIWPDREDLVTNVPQCFKDAFGLRTTVIIDCFEVFTETSSNLDAAARTWSHYKHHHTLKFLIGITPQGVICFISNAYGGRASDKFITEDCGILDKLKPNDLVVADRGFLIKNSVELALAEVITPSFLKGRNQLSPKEIEDSRKIATVRIHVERVIGLLRQKYKIFKSTLPLETVKHRSADQFMLIDKMVVVCCSFINLMPPVIPLD